MALSLEEWRVLREMIDALPDDAKRIELHRVIDRERRCLGCRDRDMLIDVAGRALAEVTPIVFLAQKIGLYWRHQEGVSTALLDELATLTKPQHEDT